MKLVSGFPVVLAAEQRAIVGELKPYQSDAHTLNLELNRDVLGHLPPRDNVGEVEIIDRFDKW